MTIEYFSDFVFKQKCMPWFIIAKWRMLITKWRALVVKFSEFAQVQHHIKTINLEKIYQNTIESPGESLDEMSMKTIEYFGDLIGDTDYVGFLKLFKNKTSVTDVEIKDTTYYQDTYRWMKTSRFHQDPNGDAALKYCRKFLTLYLSIKKRINSPIYLRFIRTTCDYLKFGYPCIFKIANSEYWMIGDGHHRLACLYVLGEKFVKAKIIGVIKNRS